MLTDTGIKKAKSKDKRYMLTDGEGLYLEIMPSGKKYWRLRYWIDKKEYKKSLGPYPTVSLKEAREARDEAKRSIYLRGQPLTRQEDTAITFKKVALEWYERRIVAIRSPRHAETVDARLKRYLFPVFGDQPIDQISSADILEALQHIEAKGKIETAHRVRGICGQVFRYGVATGQCKNDPTGALRGALTPRVGKHHAALTNRNEIAGLMRSISGMNTLLVKYALLFLAYTFVRPGELRKAEWVEIDLSSRQWGIPAAKMKMRRPHIVPLSSQAIEVLKKVKNISWNSKYIFPSVRRDTNPMSENTLLAAIRRLGYTKDEMTPHGFRSMASTTLNGNGWPSDVIERQLAHAEENEIRAAYNHAEYLPERKKMMQWWGNWLEELTLPQ